MRFTTLCGGLCQTALWHSLANLTRNKDVLFVLILTLSETAKCICYRQKNRKGKQLACLDPERG